MFERCPGFQSRDNSTEASERGQRIHDALEKGNLEVLEEVKERPIAQMCRDFIDGQLADKLPAIPNKDLREVCLDIDLGNGVETFGTCDRLLTYGDLGLMFDYKSGYREVADAEHNPQGWAYVIGAFQTFKNLNTITIYFLIPNRDQISHHTFKRDDLPQMILRLNTVIVRAQKLKALFAANDVVALLKWLNPEPELCEYCALQATCPALGAKAIDVARKLKGALVIPQSVNVDPTHPEDIQHLLRLAPLMEAWASGIRAEALKLNLETGLDIPGFVRRERKTPRSITSVLGAWQIVKDKGVPLEDFLAATSKVSMPDLEKMIAALTTKRGEKGKAKKALERDLRSADLLREQGTIYFLQESKA